MTGANGYLTFVGQELHYFAQCPANIFTLPDEKSIFDCIVGLQDAVNGSDIKLILPEKRYCTDNAAMIGAEGYLQYKLGNFADLSLNAKAVLPLK